MHRHGFVATQELRILGRLLDALDNADHRSETDRERGM
jgi:hypothetical protein